MWYINARCVSDIIFGKFNHCYTWGEATIFAYTSGDNLSWYAIVLNHAKVVE